MIVTVSREMGAGGSEIARRTAQALGWRVVDDELVDRVAARTGLPVEEVAARDERAPGFFERLMRLASRAAPELFPTAADPGPEPDTEEAALVKATEAVVGELAAEGRVVVVGRAAPAVLGRERDALHVKIVAPRAARVETVARRRGVAPAEAESEVARSDAARGRYHRQYYRRDWTDAANYHLVLNSAALGIDGAVAVIVGRARSLWPRETSEPRGG
jgi:cytidylate kinase